MNLSKEIIVILLVASVFAQGAYGISIRCTTSDDHITSSASTSGSIRTGGAFHQTIQAQGGLLTSASSGKGSMPKEDHMIWDSAGNMAWVSAKIVGSSATTWSYNWLTTKSSPEGQRVTSEEWLSASNAYSISASGNAQNKEGDYAQGDATVVKGSISRYYVKAEATPSYARVSQRADSASGYGITFNDHSNNAESDWANSQTQIKNGAVSMPSTSIPGYSAIGTATGTYALVDINNLRASAPSGWISQSLNAQNLYDSSSVTLGVDKGYLYNYPYSKSYPARAYASGYYDKTSAIQSAYMNGATVTSSAYSRINNPVTNPQPISKSTKDINKKVKVGDAASTTSTGYSARALYLL